MAVTYDPATISVGITLSGGNLVIAHTSGGVNLGGHVFDAAAQTTGKYYFELTYTTMLGYANAGLIGLGTVGTTYSQFATGTGSALAGPTGNLISSGTFYYNMGTRAQGDVVGIAVDLTAGSIWFRLVFPTVGNWNGTGAGDPVVGTNGIPVPVGAVEPYTVFNTNLDTFTLNMGLSTFAASIPSGYSLWPGVVTVPVVAPGQTFTVAQPAVVGQVVGTVAATNSPTSFTVVSGNYFGFYTIDNTGMIRVASIPVSGTSNLIVQASNVSGSGSNTVVVMAGGVASYLLLVPHYMGGAELSAGTLVTEGVQIPVGWVPTLAVDPQDSVAIQNYWNAGPQDGAEPNRDFYPWVPLASVTHWVPVAGLQGYWQLTGTGASLGSKNAPTPQLPVGPFGPSGASGTSMGLLLTLTYA